MFDFSRERGLLLPLFMFYNIFLQFFRQNTCIYQIIVVPLHQKSEKDVDTSSGKAERATQGCDSGGIAGRKTHSRGGGTE